MRLKLMTSPGASGRKLSRSILGETYRRVRGITEEICRPLQVEDHVIQSMPDVSPPKWHLAHSTWFFETFLLLPGLTGYRPVAERYSYLFNSYYKSLGSHLSRAQRGLISRPNLQEVWEYRNQVDRAMDAFISGADVATWTRLAPLLELGLHHEQQHQELLLTDIKHIFFANPLRPVYREQSSPAARRVPPIRWQEFPEGMVWLGQAEGTFGFDNERPRHRVHLQGFRLALRLVTNGEYLEFIQDGAYQNPALWLSDAWELIQAEAWEAPLYWENSEGPWRRMTLSGMQTLEAGAPVSHLSFYEADAYARWAGKRLPTEAEWECAAGAVPVEGNFYDSAYLEPRGAAGQGSGLQEIYGDVWEWTQSPYTPYPGYHPPAGPVGEYHGKFMCNQMVLRGGSCLSSASHLRPSYRNFFPPAARWQCSGLRLAEDA